MNLEKVSGASRGLNLRSSTWEGVGQTTTAPTSENLYHNPATKQKVPNVFVPFFSNILFDKPTNRFKLKIMRGYICG